LGGVFTVKHFWEVTFSQVVVGMSKHCVLSFLAQTVLSVLKQISLDCPSQNLLVSVLNPPPPFPLPGMLKHMSCLSGPLHSVLYMVRHSRPGTSLQLLMVLLSHCSTGTTLGTLMHLVLGFIVHFWLLMV